MTGEILLPNYIRFEVKWATSPYEFQSPLSIRGPPEHISNALAEDAFGDTDAAVTIAPRVENHGDGESCQVATQDGGEHIGLWERVLSSGTHGRGKRLRDSCRSQAKLVHLRRAVKPFQPTKSALFSQFHAGANSPRSPARPSLPSRRTRSPQPTSKTSSSGS